MTCCFSGCALTESGLRLRALTTIQTLHYGTQSSQGASFNHYVKCSHQWIFHSPSVQNSWQAAGRCRNSLSTLTSSLPFGIETCQCRLEEHTKIQEEAVLALGPMPLFWPILPLRFCYSTANASTSHISYTKVELTDGPSELMTSPHTR